MRSSSSSRASSYRAGGGAERRRSRGGAAADDADQDRPWSLDLGNVARRSRATRAAGERRGTERRRTRQADAEPRREPDQRARFRATGTSASATATRPARCSTFSRSCRSAISESTNVILRVIMPLTSQPGSDGTRINGLGDIVATVFFSPREVRQDHLGRRSGLPAAAGDEHARSAPRSSASGRRSSR